MKSSKRILALIVAMIFVLTSMVSFNVFAADDIAFTDLDATNSYYQAISSLVADGVINGYAEADGTYTFKPDNTITRAEFSKLLALASNPNYAYTATTTQFSDLQSADAEGGWAIPYIAYAVGTGAINGYEDGTFRPQNPVTYAEATKMIVCTLGYGVVVDTTLTPWYQGYVDVAHQIGLTKRAGGNPDTPAVRGLVAQLIYNMANECKVYSAVVGNDGSEIKINTGSSGSSTMNDSEEGILYGVFDFCLTGDELTKSQVLIGDEIYQLGKYEAEELKDLVGYSVSFSINDSRKKELSKVSKLSGENDKIVVEDWLIDNVSSSEMEYFANEDDYYDDEISTIRFSSNMYVIYNGFVVDPDDITSSFIKEYLDVENGDITFISNDGNAKTAELAIVESYDLYFVKSATHNNGTTTFYEANQAETGVTSVVLKEDDVLDSEDNANVTKISSKGGSAQKSTLSGITKNSIVAVAEPYGKKEGTKVIISAVSFNSTVKEISDDNYIMLGSDKYEFSTYFYNLVEKGMDLTLEIGDYAKFYLDPFGKIAYFEKTETNSPYGLIIAYAEGKGVDSIPQLQVLNESGKLLEYPLKDSVEINGKDYDASDVIGVLKKTSPIYKEMEDADSKNIVQPIRYATSTQNGVTVFSELETLGNSEEGITGSIVPYPINNSKHTEKKMPYAKGGTLTFADSGDAFKHGTSTQFTMSSTTKAFLVPTDYSNKSGYKKISATGYFGDGHTYIVEPYDVETGTTPKLVICYATKENAPTTVYSKTPVAFVEKIIDATKDNVVGKKLIYYNPGSYESKEEFVPGDSDVIDNLEELSSGDIIKFVKDDNEISQIKYVYVGGKIISGDENNGCGDIKDGFANYITKANGTKNPDYFQVIMGTISTLEDGNKITVVPMFVDDAGFAADIIYPFRWDDNTSFFDYDEKNKEFIETSEGALRSYEDASKDATQVIIVISNTDDVVAIYDLSKVN